MEERFGRKHPAMENFREPLPPYRFLVDAFFRLHRRRQFSQHGYQPIAYQEMADFGERVLGLHPSMMKLYYAAMEAADNGVLYDHFQKSKADVDAAKAEAEKRKPKARRGRR